MRAELMEFKPAGIEGLYSVKDDGPIGPHHRKVKSVIDSVLNVAAHVELECGHTVVIMNPGEYREAHGGLVFCGECAGLPENAKPRPQERSR
jgi:hypothetical protein